MKKYQDIITGAGAILLVIGVITMIIMLIIRMPNNEKCREVKVQRVVDGDTVVLMGAKRLRFERTDAPELATFRGQQAAALLRALIKETEAEPKGKVVVCADGSRDRYGRSLGELYLVFGSDWKSVSEVLLENKLVREWK